MYFKQVLNEKCGCASYVIACHTGAAAVVDPALDIQEYEDLLQARELTLRYVIDTHVHADHVSGARRLVERFGGEHCMYHAAAVSYPCRRLRDGEELELGKLRLQVIHTPGHRPELISLLIVNPPRSPEASMVLTGDSLLVGDVGRPDFGGGDAAQQYESVQRLLSLPDWVAVFPGHFEGPCGKGMCGRPSTTIGFERRFNPMVSLDREQFLQILSSDIPPRPLNMIAVEATNRGAVEMEWAMLTPGARAPEAPIEAVDGRHPESILLDVREPQEYAQSHVPGASNLPQAELATRLEEVPADRPVYVICHTGMRSRRAAEFLGQMGYRNAFSVRGGTEAWREAGKPLVECESESGAPKIVESDWTHGGARVAL